MDYKARLRTYYYLTKPGIIYGNAVNATAGFALASSVVGRLLPGRFVAMLVGSSLIVAAGCVYNNYMDRGIDRKMARTKKRALVRGTVSVRAAMVYATVLGVAGFSLLAAGTNALTVVVGAVGFFDYVVLYGYFKRRSAWGTLVGSVSGATPPLAGYVAVTGRLDAAAGIIFAMLVCWQMPHFYAIAIYRMKDYAAAGLPVLPIRRGTRATKIQMCGFVVAFAVAAALLTVRGYTGYVYLLVMLVASAVWLRLALRGFRAADETKWARQMFFFSLIVTLITAAMLSVGGLLP